MSAKHRCNRDGSQKARYPFSPLTPANAGRSRPALLAGAPLLTLAALGAPGVAWAGSTHTISTGAGTVIVTTGQAKSISPSWAIPLIWIAAY
jgi:hypothetical protein